MTTISGILIFDIDVSWSGYLPIIPGCNGCNGDDGTFTYTNNPEWYYTNNNTRVNVPFSFTDNGTTNSGFTFQNIPIGQQGRITKIVDFGGIPLSRAINQFKDPVNPYNGNFPDDVDNLPTLLSGTNVQNLFQGTNFNGNISLWDINIVNPKNLSGMFQNSTIFNQDLSSWNIEQVINMFNMLDNSGLSVENYDNTLIGWAFQQIQPNVTLGALNLQYSSSGELARNFLINEPNNWTINGDSLICFIKNTMILILENCIEVERKVQELQNGDMVKISNGEYKKLVFIGTKKIDITKNIDKIRIMKQGILGNNLPNKDLLVTSGHSLLFTNLNYANEFYKSEFYDNNVEDYYKIMSQHCKLFKYVKEEELENIRDGDNVSYYHFCLENNDEEGQYGVYSNGVLSETMALSFSKKNYMNKN